LLKDRVRREKLIDTETLSSRVIEGSEDIPVEHIQNFIQHSINVIPKCLNKEQNLCDCFSACIGRVVTVNRI
ncbi:hypothetical protein BCV71DRAFT_176693, partial [Rhizopus microsporus]